MRYAAFFLLLTGLMSSGCAATMLSRPAQQSSTPSAFDGARWIRSLPRSADPIDLTGQPLAELSAAAPDIAQCLAGDLDGHEVSPVEGAAGATATRLPSGSVLVMSSCPLDVGTGAYGGYFAAGVVSDQGVRMVDFVGVDEETHAFAQHGRIDQGIDVLDDLDQGMVHVLHKYRGAGGCGQFVTYRLSEDGRSLMAETVREQACDSGPPDHEPLSESVIFNSTCDGEPCYDPKLWSIVWRRAE